LAPLQSVTNTTPRALSSRQRKRQTVAFTSLLPRFRPLQRFASHGEHHNPEETHLLGYVAPSGFLTLSTPCSPHDLPGLFHPGSAHGVHPSRPCSPAGAIRPLERRCPPGVGGTRCACPPSRLCTPSRIPHASLGFSQKPAPDAPLGFVPVEASCITVVVENESKPTIPSHAFHTQSQVTICPASQGIDHHERSISLSRHA
jgi:hypothetical protein